MTHQLTKGTQAYLLAHDVLYLTKDSREYIFNDEPSRFIVDMIQSKKTIEDLSNSKHLKHRTQAFILRDWLIEKDLIEIDCRNESRITTATETNIIDLSQSHNNLGIDRSVTSIDIGKNKKLNVRTYSYGYDDKEKLSRHEWGSFLANKLVKIIKENCISIRDTMHEAVNIEVHAQRLDMISYKTDKELSENELIIPIIYNSKRVEIGPIYQTKTTDYVDILNERVTIRTGAAHTLSNNKPFVPPNSERIPIDQLENLAIIIGHIIEEKAINLAISSESQKQVWSFNRQILEYSDITNDPDSFLVARTIHKLEPILEEQCLKAMELDEIKVFPKNLKLNTYAIGRVPTLTTLKRGEYKNCEVIDGGRRILSASMTRQKIKPFVDVVTGVIEKIELESINKDIYTYSGTKVFGATNRSMKITQNTARSTGFPVSAAGKGRTAYQSQVSCIAEALERYSANYPILKVPEIKLKYSDNPEIVIHPNEIMQYSEYQFANRHRINSESKGLIHKVPKQFNENDEIYWTPVINLICKEKSKLIPTSMLGFNYTKNLQEGTAICCSNGLSSGNSVSEAMVQAIYEVIERDSCAIWWYNKIKVSEARIPDDLKYYANDITNGLKELGRNINLLNLPTDFPIHVIACVSHKEDGQQICVGLGSHSDYSIAVSRAITEMYQMMVGETTKLQKRVNRDGNGGIDFIVQKWLLEENIVDHCHLIPSNKISSIDNLSQKEEYNFIHIEEELEWLLEIFKKKEMDIYGANYTAKSVGFPVSKVFIPEMRHFWPRLAPGRLYDLPVKLGYLKEAKQESELNPIGFFF